MKLSRFLTAIPRRLPLVSAMLWEIDTVTIRFTMALASIIFAFFMMLNSRPFRADAYNLMEWVGPRWFWAIVFVVYGVFTCWLVWDDVKNGIHRARLNLAFNIYGFVIWAFCLFSVCMALRYLPPFMSLYFVTIPLLG